MSDLRYKPFDMPPVYVLKVRQKNDYPYGERVFLVYRDDRVINFSCGTLKRRELQLRYQEIDSSLFHGPGGGGSFDAFYEPALGGPLSNARISLTGGAVMISDENQRGLHLGTYFMNQIVSWARQWPDVPVESIWVASADGYNKNRERRNRFYEQFGLVFKYSDAERREGHSAPIPAGLLNLSGAWRSNITEYPLDDYLGSLLRENVRLANELQTTRDIAERCMRDYQRAESNPLIWGVRTFFESFFNKYWAVMVVLIILYAFYCRFS